jgi:excisionase family DNA binding protein
MELDLVTVAEAAALLGRSPDMVRKLEAAGHLRAAGRFGPNRARLFRRADVVALAETRGHLTKHVTKPAAASSMVAKGA